MYYVYVYELPFEWHLQTRVHMCVSSNMNSNFCVHIQWQFLMSLLAHFLLHSAVFQSKWWDVHIYTVVLRNHTDVHWSNWLFICNSFHKYVCTSTFRYSKQAHILVYLLLQWQRTVEHVTKSFKLISHKPNPGCWTLEEYFLNGACS